MPHKIDHWYFREMPRIGKDLDRWEQEKRDLVRKAQGGDVFSLIVCYERYQHLRFPLVEEELMKQKKPMPWMKEGECQPSARR